jgi:hypothetical protein
MGKKVGGRAGGGKGKYHCKSKQDCEPSSKVHSQTNRGKGVAMGGSKLLLQIETGSWAQFQSTDRVEQTGRDG